MIQYVDGVVAVLGLIGAIVGVYVKLTNKIAILKEKVTNLKSDVILHEQLNERTFSEVLKEMKEMRSQLDKLVGYFEGNGTFKQK